MICPMLFWDFTIPSVDRLRVCSSLLFVFCMFKFGLIGFLFDIMVLDCILLELFCNCIYFFLSHLSLMGFKHQGVGAFICKRRESDLALRHLLMLMRKFAYYDNIVYIASWFHFTKRWPRPMRVSSICLKSCLLQRKYYSRKSTKIRGIWRLRSQFCWHFSLASFWVDIKLRNHSRSI